MKQVEQLLPLLDRQMALLQEKRSLLRQMGECVGAGELEELRELVDKQAILQSEESEIERRTCRLRAELARLTDEDAEAVTLGRLVETLDGQAAIALSDRRERLTVLVEQLRQEALRTAMRVRQAMELNEQILCILGGGQQPGRTYAPDGEVRRGHQVGTYQQSV